MSDVMLIGILRMPQNLWSTCDPVGETQRHDTYLQAADRIESDAAEIEKLKAQVHQLIRIIHDNHKGGDE